MKRLALIISTIVFISFLSSCTKKENIPVREIAPKNVEKIRTDYHKNFLKKLRVKTNRIEVCSYKLIGNTIEDTTIVLKRKNLITPGKLKAFNTLFDSLKNRGYYCCPKTHYTMKLFNKNIMLKRFNIDTTEFRGKALIFDTSLQTTYLLTLKDWHNLIE